MTFLSDVPKWSQVTFLCDVIQEVEYVKEEAKLGYLLECLQKTAPPVLVFGERTSPSFLDTMCQYSD